MSDNPMPIQEAPAVAGDPRKANFARQRPGVPTLDRAAMAVRSVVRADGTRPPVAAPDPAAVAAFRSQHDRCAACQVNGSCASYCRSCGTVAVVGPCPLGLF